MFGWSFQVLSAVRLKGELLSFYLFGQYWLYSFKRLLISSIFLGYTETSYLYLFQISLFHYHRIIHFIFSMCVFSSSVIAILRMKLSYKHYGYFLFQIIFIFVSVAGKRNSRGRYFIWGCN